MITATATPPVSVTDDDMHLLHSVYDALEKASTGNVDPTDVWRLSRELDAMLHRWQRQRREGRA